MNFLYQSQIESRLLKILNGFDELAKGNFKSKIQMSGRHELAKLAEKFNDTVEKLKGARKKEEQFYQEKLERADRLITLGEVAAEIAHEVNNPAGIILTRAELIKDEMEENCPDCPAKDDLNIPDMIICFYDTILSFDHVKSEYSIISTGFPERGKKALYRKRARLESLKNRIQNLEEKEVFTTRKKPINLESNFTKDSYKKAIKKAKEYIKAGDIYQVNLSQRFKVDLDMDPFDLYKILRKINPAPFAAYLNFGDVKIVSASPERFLKKEGNYIETRPIKGTRPRGSNLSEDKRLKDELTHSVKDKAENLMIIDLERNDLGRISEYGSVHVKEFMTCEKYATVFHLVSTVTGKLRKNKDAVDCLLKCFPGGSITGAPKIRSMEIIEELEPFKRSVYTGSIGYLSFNGNMDTSIVIRTFIIKDKKAYFQVGGGIVYDSDPEKEYEETLHKGKALIEAISYENSVYKQKVHSA